MKLKSFLIIFLILGFFMATGVRPASADYSAEVSVKSEFDAATKTVKVTNDSEYVPIDNAGVILDENKYDAAISNNTRNIHVKISPAFTRKMKYDDVRIEFYRVQGFNQFVIYFPYTPALLSTATKSECEFVVPDVDDASYSWIRVIVRDENGNNPQFAWIQKDNNPLSGGPAPVTFVPDVSGDWQAGTTLSFYNSFYLSADASNSAGENMYLWWVDNTGKKLGSIDTSVNEDMLNVNVALQLDIYDSMDQDFSIRWTDRGSNGSNSIADEWIGNFEEISGGVFNSHFDDMLNPGTKKNVLTYKNGTPSILLPPLPGGMSYNALRFYYKGVELTQGASAPLTYKGTNYTQYPVSHAIFNGLDASADWSHENEKVVVEFNDGTVNNLSYAGADDGVGPYLVSAHVDYDNKKIVKLEFSENLKKSKIASITKNELILMNTHDAVQITVQSVVVDPDNSSRLIVTTSTKVEEEHNATANLSPVAVGTETIMDNDENVAPILGTPVNIAIERKINKVSVVNVDASPDVLGGTPVTHIEIEFDKAMDALTIEDIAAYYVEMVPGLEEAADPNDGANIRGVVYSAALNTTTNEMEYKAIIEVEGRIESTAKADLPRVKVIGEDVAGSSGGPIRVADFDKFFAPEDKVGPYLVSASYNMNPIQGKTAQELIEDHQSHTLALVFSEEVRTEYKIDETSFGSVGFNAANALDRMTFSDCVKDPNDRWVITGKIDDRVDEADAIYQSSGFGGAPVIFIAASAIPDFQDALENNASFSNAKSQVPVTDETPVWIESAKTGDTDNNGIVDVILVDFGKNASLNLLDFEDAKAIKFNGDPNVIDYGTTNLVGNTLTIVLKEVDGLGNARPKDTGMTPTILLDLSDSVSIEDTTKADSYLTDDISVKAVDNANPVITNRIVSVPADPTDDLYAQKKSAKLYMVTLLFSEKMDPAIYEVPEDAYTYFYKPGTVGADPNVITFLTSTSTPPAPTAELSCGGNRIVVLLNHQRDLGHGSLEIEVRPNRMEDLMELPLNGTNDLNFQLIAKPNIDVYTPPAGAFQGQTPFQSAVAMTLTGNIIDPNGREALAGTRIYAFHRDELFDTDDTSDDILSTGTNSQALNVGFDFRAFKCYGSATIQNDVDNDPNGYAMKIYGKMFADDAEAKGFVDGEPVILVVDRMLANGNFVSKDATNDVEIATTACLANTAYSLKFEGRKKKIFNIDLRKREEIRLQPGWNFVSTSIATSYYNKSLSTMKGIDPDSYTGYIYTPSDPLSADKGSLPSKACEMGDITEVLFAISNSAFAKTLIYDISDPIDAVVDELGDKFNKTSSFVPGRAYYIYVQENKNQWKNWRIVLFGDKIPSADCKLKAHGGTNLIGHWGGKIYITANGPSDLTEVQAASTINVPNNEIYIDYIAVPENFILSAPTSFGLNITDMDGNDVQASIVSSYYNYGGNNPIMYVADWFSDEEPEFSNLTFMAPGGGYYLILDGANEEDTVFINYYNLME